MTRAGAGKSTSHTPNTLEETAAGVRKRLWAAFFFSGFINCLMLVSPLYMLQIYDRVLGSGSIETLIYLTIVASGLLLAYGILEALRNQFLIHLGIQFEQRLGCDLYRHLVPLSLRNPQSQPEQCLSDTETIRQFFSGQSITCLLDAPFAPLFLIVLFLLHPWLGVTALIGALLLAAIAISNELLTRKGYQQAGSLSRSNRQFIQTSFRNADTIEAMGLYDQLDSQWANRHNTSLQTYARPGLLGAALKGLVKFLRPTLQIIILGLGAYLTLQGDLTAGAIIAGSILMGRALSPVEQAIGTWPAIIQARGAYQRLRQVFELVTQNASSERTALPAPEGKVTIEALALQAPDQGPLILKNINLNTGPGQLIAIIGPSGAGKSSLLKAMAGTWPPLRGTVRLDEADIANWPYQQKAALMGYMPQGVELFEGTIAHNIARMGEPDVTALHQACAMAGVNSLIHRLPDGFDTLLRDDGKPLSAGERQRIGLARALYGLPAVLLLDEPNAHLDYEGEMALDSCLQELKTLNRTVFIVSHRTNILKRVDRVIMLQEGLVVADGPYEQIMSQMDASGVPHARRAKTRTRNKASSPPSFYNASPYQQTATLSPQSVKMSETSKILPSQSKEASS
jgi:PrtD family type I secretion system ABC transporter